MKTKREALAEQGLAIAGARGKFSKAANLWLDEQRAKGVVFSDDTTQATPKAEKPTGAGKPVAAKESRMPEFLFPDEYRYPETEYAAYYRENGKKVRVGLRECCNSCKVSLVNHGCDEPTVWDNRAVTIEKILSKTA